MNIRRYFLFIFLLCFSVSNLFGQTASETGGWFYESSTGNEAKIYPKTHSGPPTVFPGTGVRGDNHKTPFSLKEKNKVLKIVDALKEVNPKPKYHSMLYWLFPQAPGRLDQAIVTKRQYRFNYFIGLQYEYMGLANGKLSNQFGGQFMREFDFLNVNVNSIPDFLGGKRGDFDNAYEGPLFELEDDFTYKKYNGQRRLPIGGSDERAAFPRDETKDIIVSIENRAESFVEAAKHFGNGFGVVPFNFGTEADNHLVYRRFSSSRLHHSGRHLIYGKIDPKYDKYNYLTANNMVILSHNNKLPFKPLTIERFLNIGDKILDEDIAYIKQNTNTTEAIKKENFDKHARTRAFIQNLRETYQNRLQEPAIIDVRYAHVSDIAWGYIVKYKNKNIDEINNRLTDKYEPANQVARRFFISDPKLGKAFYTYDTDFYKNMADGEIRTIAVIWKDYIRTPDNPNFGKGYSIGKDGVEQNRFTDNPDHYLYHFGKKFDWKKFAAVLGK